MSACRLYVIDKKSIGGLILASLLLTALALDGCNSTSASTDPAAGTSPKGQKGKGGRGKDGGGGAIPVVTAKVATKTVPIEITGVGNVEAYSTINVVSQIGGQLTQAYFQEGDFVRKGEKLFSIDPSPIEAQVAQAEANVARDEALLSQAEANLARDSANQKYAEDQAGRYSKLFDEGVVSREQRDQFVSSAGALTQTIKADQAAENSSKAQIKADQANVKNLRVQMAYSTVYSPIDGRTGNLAVKVGNIVIPGTMVLVTITQVQPIYVTFSVPETHFAELRRSMVDSKTKLAVKATPQDGSSEPEEGVLTFADNNIDATTGTIKLKATFPNTNRKLWPGAFTNVTLRMGVQENALIVPNQVVQTGQDGNYVYVVKDDQTVEMRTVTPGMRVNDDLVIEKGLEAGETVVSEGQLRLTDGSRVQMRGAADAAPGFDKKGRGKKRSSQ